MMTNVVMSITKEAGIKLAGAAIAAVSGIALVGFGAKKIRKICESKLAEEESPAEDAGAEKVEGEVVNENK